MSTDFCTNCGEIKKIAYQGRFSKFCADCAPKWASDRYEVISNEEFIKLCNSDKKEYITTRLISPKLCSEAKDILLFQFHSFIIFY